MKARTLTTAGLLVAVLWPLLPGCGTEDSDPPLYSEARYEVIPQGGEAVFEVVSLVGGSVEHEFAEGVTFTSTATFNFLVENAPPPHMGTFRHVGGAQIRVCVSVGEQVFVMCSESSPDSPTVTVRAGSAGPDTPIRRANPDVRFDICAPETGQGTCGLTGAAGRFLDFEGSVGDLRVTHLIRRATNGSSLLKTPAVVLLQGAEDEVSGVFRAADNQLLRVELLVNGRIVDGSVDSGDVVVRDDL